MAQSASATAGLPVPAVCLVVLDGWALAPEGPGNAVALADTPVMDALWARYPHAQLRTCGPDVGLPPGQMGNSEVGHLNLGAGAVVKQDLLRIDEALLSDPPAGNDVLRDALASAERVHLIGLVSDGGVHSSLEHLQALVALGREVGVPDLVIHAFTDGRDTSPSGGVAFLERVEGFDGARVGTVIGRYYAMDRDRREERTERARALLVDGTAAHHVEHASDAAREAYERGETDEFIDATTVGAEARIRPQDTVIAFNFRPDRMRQITEALAHEPSRYVTLTEYVEGWPYPIAFPPHRPSTTLPVTIASAGLRQLHVAETEKYPHVTYFFGGGEEQPQEGERRELVPSPRDVPTYDFKPAMSGPEAAAAFVSAWAQEDFGFGIINFANADMVGHTGVVPAAVEAVQTADRCLGEIVEAVRARGGVCVITADHGNADFMINEDGSPNTAHTLNPVPFVVTLDGVELRDEGILADVAPTVLQLLGLDQPEAMTGQTMLA
ncbi:MAG: 2,3-bisphosphoglycerate-independent phosphoglycerate mutase [Solirubrobacterales bacterium]|nr:2,3-bisphosphoglycerate-independent phosphoglycerate mutase [Solirubrobacterales bacterium]